MRIRSIKPEFVRSEQIAELTFRQRILFIGLWMLADKNGCLKCAPRRIKADLFPFDDVTVAEVQEDLQRTSEVLLTYLYRTNEAGEVVGCDEVEEAEYLFIINFVKHQRLTAWEKKESQTEIPVPRDFISTSEALQKHFSLKRGEERISEELKRGEEEASSPLPKGLADRINKYLEMFRSVHSECARTSEMAFGSAIRACVAEEAPDAVFAEALDAFTRHCAGVVSFRPQTSLGKFENYLRRSIENYKKNGAGSSEGVDAQNAAWLDRRKKATGVK